MLGLGIEAVEDISLQLGSGGVSKAHAELAGEGRSYQHAMFQVPGLSPGREEWDWKRSTGSAWEGLAQAETGCKQETMSPGLCNKVFERKAY